MYTEKKVTAVTITQNSAELIESAFKSFAYQDYENLEWVVVDNASSDETLAKIAQYQAKDSRIKCVALPEKKDLATLLNAAFSVSNGAYIAFLEPADVWVKDKIKRQLGYVIRYKAPISHTSYAFIDKECNVLPVGCSKIEQFINLVNYRHTANICFSTAMLCRDDVKNYLPVKLQDSEPDVLLYFMQKGLTSQGMTDVLSLCRLQYGPPTPAAHEPRIEKLSKEIRKQKKRVPNAMRYDAYKANNIAKIALESSEFIDDSVYYSMNELKNMKL